MPFLKKVDDYVHNKIVAGEKLETFLAKPAILQDFVYLETFRNGLLQFLAEKGLPTALCESDAQWDTFLAAYSSVIEDGSLTCKGSEELRIVDRITFTKGPQTMENTHVPFGIKWNIRLRDGQSLELEVGAQADRKLVQWGLRLKKEVSHE
jgi:hypothetical protein